MKINLRYQGKQQFKADARDFKEIVIDEPESFHGDNQGPSPIEYFLIGIGSCIASSLVFCLNKEKIKFSNFEVVVEGKLKHKGPNLRLKLVKIIIQINFRVLDDKSKERVEYCMSIFESHCPLSDSIIQSIPIILQINEKKKN
ncbi:MAG: OsmC family peroxiredoxin [Promethearchaeota archaeon]|nr:MAG: OsmC family peroxiredoxin [Candidatus Lokiarchaeota archaeon]